MDSSRMPVLSDQESATKALSVQAVRTLASVLLFLFAYVHATAEDVLSVGALTNCAHGPSSVANIIEPLEDNTRTYANGNVRIIHLDTGGEPVCCSAYVAILAPDPTDHLLGRQCLLLTSDAAGSGFMSIAFSDITSRYDQKRGLLLSVPTERYVDTVSITRNVINVRINQTSGVIAIE